MLYALSDFYPCVNVTPELWEGERERESATVRGQRLICILYARRSLAFEKLWNFHERRLPLVLVFIHKHVERFLAFSHTGNTILGYCTLRFSCLELNLITRGHFTFPCLMPSVWEKGDSELWDFCRDNWLYTFQSGLEKPSERKYQVLRNIYYLTTSSTILLRAFENQDSSREE